jgi:hypothetical protein
MNSVGWNTKGFIPPIIMNPIYTRHPTCHLYLKLPDGRFAMRWGRRDRSIPFATWQKSQEAKDSVKVFQPIIGSPVLYSLSMYARNNRIDTPSKVEFVHGTLRACPYLRELQFEIGYGGRNGCGEHRADNLPDFNFTDPTFQLQPLDMLVSLPALCRLTLRFTPPGPRADPKRTRLMLSITPEDDYRARKRKRRGF